ncbi:hypothetical protein CC1G_14565 [Coprinopsis cinerea okayama7|uniref:Chromatin target of PRMT1 protein C-terminal domain-containing protein n=1 Tax=Coprinopsis cinerea (strain Okayama-7 / 130 / ATCC MYA-4618 / FGSC 9003) TaxID=240176 RepID=D6RMN7_COPC7|nr:hypothetical protein CC1G_14565 [Coprinopsis cinerea okayama7\|eukprot:XP_002911133.1 hypothetical protein CC1G_14565 [Coprinopsis cinerea okayama7\
MDIDADTIAPTTGFATEPEPTLLSYDETVPYEEQIQPENDPSSLANRIGKGKIYLLSEAAGSSSVKRRATSEVQDADEDMMDDDDPFFQDPNIRPNALFFTGQPIAYLPTTRIFAYATHFEAHPLGLEWVSDTTCVLVFSSKAEAKRAYAALQKTPGEETSVEDGCVTAKSIPVALWPPEERITRTLGIALNGKEGDAEATGNEEREKRKQGLAAPLRMRWATKDDVKKKGARKESEFYKKHGRLAGKELINGRDIPTLPGAANRKRRRDEMEEDDDAIRARLDRELDEFLAEEPDSEDGRAGKESASNPEDEGDAAVPDSPPSKMRSDYIADDGRTVIQKRGSSASGGMWSRGGGSSGRRSRGGRGRRRGGDDDMDIEPSHGLSLSERLQGSASGRWERGNSPGAPDRKRRRGGGGDRDRNDSPRPRRGDSERRRGGGRTEPRPKKTQQELDDELDAFLRQG